MVPAAVLLLLAGCENTPKAVNPVAWWHSMEGGEIAQDRPPPPKSTDPYPHIANAPTRPAGMPDWEWRDLQATLASQGAAARQYAAQNPIPTLPNAPPAPAGGQPAAQPAPAVTVAPVASAPSPAAPASGSAAPGNAAPNPDAEAIRRLAAAQGPAGGNTGLPPAATINAAATASHGSGAGQPQAGQPQASGVTLDTASPAPHSAGPGNIPVNETGQVVTNYQVFDANNGLSVPGALGPVAQPDEAHPPAVPTSVPAPPAVPGFAISPVPSTYAPPKNAAEPLPYAPPPPLPNDPPVPVAFKPGSAVLSPLMQRALGKFAAARQGNRIAITGYGDAPGEAPADQADAMPLALERARAITVELMADGVPPAQLDTGAAAQGSGGLARLVN